MVYKSKIQKKLMKRITSEGDSTDDERILKKGNADRILGKQTGTRLSGMKGVEASHKKKISKVVRPENIVDKVRKRIQDVYDRKRK